MTDLSDKNFSAIKNLKTIVITENNEIRKGSDNEDGYQKMKIEKMKTKMLKLVRMQVQLKKFKGTKIVLNLILFSKRRL